MMSHFAIVENVIVLLIVTGAVARAIKVLAADAIEAHKAWMNFREEFFPPNQLD